MHLAPSRRSMPHRWPCTATARIAYRLTRRSKHCGRPAPTCNPNTARLPAVAWQSTYRNVDGSIRTWSDAVMATQTSPVRSDRELLDLNRRFYDLLWSGARLVEPQ